MYDYGNYGSYSPYSSFDTIFGAAMGIIVIVFIIFAAISVLEIIGVWKILVKGNKPGWGALIPGYNQYLLCQVVGVNPWWVLIVVCSSIFTVIPFIGSLISSVIIIYYTILVNVSLARSFGKSDGYAVGLILLAPFFTFALGSKNNQYLGPRPMNDIVFNKIKDMSNNNQAQPNNTTTVNNASPNYGSAPVNNVDPNVGVTPDNNVASNADVVPSGDADKYCPSCGTKVSAETKFCPTCGKQL